MVLCLIIAAISGVLLHQILMRNEFDEHPVSIIGVAVSSVFVLAKYLQLTGIQDDFQTAILEAFRGVLCSIISLLINTLIYRVFLHPLNNFPGPLGAKVSKFWALGKVIQSRVRWYLVAGELHEKYGDYVRTGELRSHLEMLLI